MMAQVAGVSQYGKATDLSSPSAASATAATQDFASVLGLSSDAAVGTAAAPVAASGTVAKAVAQAVPNALPDAVPALSVLQVSSTGALPVGTAGSIQSVGHAAHVPVAKQATSAVVAPSSLTAMLVTIPAKDLATSAETSTAASSISSGVPVPAKVASTPTESDVDSDLDAADLQRNEAGASVAAATLTQEFQQGFGSAGKVDATASRKTSAVTAESSPKAARAGDAAAKTATVSASPGNGVTVAAANATGDGTTGPIVPIVQVVPTSQSVQAISLSQGASAGSLGIVTVRLTAQGTANAVAPRMSASGTASASGTKTTTGFAQGLDQAKVAATVAQTPVHQGADNSGGSSTAASVASGVTALEPAATAVALHATGGLEAVPAASSVHGQVQTAAVSQPANQFASQAASSLQTDATPGTQAMSAGLSQAGLPQTALRATPTSLEVGVSSGTHGWLKIRAELAPDGGVNASLSGSSSAAASGLRGDLPALTSYLQSEKVSVSSVVVAAVTPAETTHLSSGLDGGSGSSLTGSAAGADAGSAGGRGQPEAQGGATTLSHGGERQGEPGAQTSPGTAGYGGGLAINGVSGDGLAGSGYEPSVEYGSGGSWLNVRA